MLEQIEKFLPDLEKFVSKNVLQNEKSLKVALSKGYEILPFYIRAVVKEEAFVNFCMENKHVLLGGKPLKKAVKKMKKSKSISKKKK